MISFLRLSSFDAKIMILHTTYQQMTFESYSPVHEIVCG